MTLQLYDHLLRFQLFQGLSRTELLQMAGNTKFGFRKEKAGVTLVQEDILQNVNLCHKITLMKKERLHPSRKGAFS